MHDPLPQRFLPLANAGFPLPFGARSGPNTATPSEADIDPGARFLSRYLGGTRIIVSLSAHQIPRLPPKSASLSRDDNLSSLSPVCHYPRSELHWSPRG